MHGCRIVTSALQIYSKPIGEWDVSTVDDMGTVFCGNDKWCDCEDLCEGLKDFNKDLSAWNVSAVKYA